MSLTLHGRRVWVVGSRGWADGRAAVALVAALVVAALLMPCGVRAQQQAAAQNGAQNGAGAPDNPLLHKRTAAEPEGPPPAPLVATGHSNLPPEAEGEYPWNKAGDTIELYFESGKLNGYMSESADPDNQHAAPLTYNFATTHADGSAVEFTTRVIHSTWYTFHGHLERGLVASPTLPGYYLLTGTLTQHGGVADGYQRVVSLKREPGQP